MLWSFGGELLALEGCFGEMPRDGTCGGDEHLETIHCFHSV